MKVHERLPPASKPRRRGYRGSGTAAMCGDGPHPGGPLFQRLCALADRFREVADDPAAARISSALSLLAVHAARSPEDDFRRRLGSILMDLAIEEERVRAAANPGGPVPYDRLLP